MVQYQKKKTKKKTKITDLMLVQSPYFFVL